MGELLGWDGADAGVGDRVATLRDRFPADLRHAPAGPELDSLPFSSLYLLDDEWAAEIANRTIHGVMHIGWVADQTGVYRGQMAVLVKPNGLLGTAYLAAIKPFRHLIVYPAMLRALERSWHAPGRFGSSWSRPPASDSASGHVGRSASFVCSYGCAGAPGAGRPAQRAVRRLTSQAPVCRLPAPGGAVRLDGGDQRGSGHA